MNDWQPNTESAFITGIFVRAGRRGSTAARSWAYIANPIAAASTASRNATIQRNDGRKIKENPKGNKAPAAAFTSLVLPALFLLLPGCVKEPPSPRSGFQPTQYEEMGPFYRPNAPVRDRVGRGYELSGTVLSSGDCQPIPKARIEFWLVNPQGEYDDAHRATLFADRKGRYRFESKRPTNYVGRKPHIHIMATAAGYEQLITQHYPLEDDSEGAFALVLEPFPAK